MKVEQVEAWLASGAPRGAPEHVEVIALAVRIAKIFRRDVLGDVVTSIAQIVLFRRDPTRRPVEGTSVAVTPDGKHAVELCACSDGDVQATWAKRGTKLITVYIQTPAVDREGAEAHMTKLGGAQGVLERSLLVAWPTPEGIVPYNDFVRFVAEVRRAKRPPD